MTERLSISALFHASRLCTCGAYQRAQAAAPDDLAEAARQYHNKLSSRSQKALYEQRKAAGLCVTCGRPFTPQGSRKARCQSCARDRYDTRLAKQFSPL